MKPFSAILALAALSFCQSALADARLEKTLGLSHEQAAQVDDIQASARLAFSSKRQAYNRENRVLRRARIEHDVAAIEAAEKIVADLRQDLIAIRTREINEIMALLNPSQRKQFEVELEKQKKMVGSSRDAKITGF